MFWIRSRICIRASKNKTQSKRFSKQWPGPDQAAAKRKILKRGFSKKSSQARSKPGLPETHGRGQGSWSPKQNNRRFGAVTQVVETTTDLPSIHRCQPIQPWGTLRNPRRQWRGARQSDESVANACAAKFCITRSQLRDPQIRNAAHLCVRDAWIHARVVADCPPPPRPPWLPAAWPALMGPLGNNVALAFLKHPPKCGSTLAFRNNARFAFLILAVVPT